jgi:hypothetical protein
VGVYVTVAELRGEPEVPDAAPPADAELEGKIAIAEDQIDAWLGVWPVQTSGPSSGRKIVQTYVEAWQWDKLKRAARRLAARLYATPDLLQAPEWGSVSGPDFSTSNYRGTPAARIPDVVAPLTDSDLRRFGARLR